MATRKAVFLGNVSVGGRSYEKGDEEYVRPQDVQALIDTGVVRWVAKPKRKKAKKGA